jgi:hypothetical protein
MKKTPFPDFQGEILIFVIRRQLQKCSSWRGAAPTSSQNFSISSLEKVISPRTKNGNFGLRYFGLRYFEKLLMPKDAS